MPPRSLALVLTLGTGFSGLERASRLVELGLPLAGRPLAGG